MTATPGWNAPMTTAVLSIAIGLVAAFGLSYGADLFR
jgi:hypothetical protein